jgi:NAD+ kinase
MRIAFVASTIEEAVAARVALVARYGDAPLDQADVIVALGGDGFMLQTLHRHNTREKSRPTGPARRTATVHR